MFLPHPRVKVSIAGSLCDREVASSASDRQGSNFESRVWRTVSSQSSHHPQEVLLAQFSLYVHTGSLKPDSFHFQRIISKRKQMYLHMNEWTTFVHIRRYFSSGRLPVILNLYKCMHGQRNNILKCEYQSQ